MTKLMSTVTGTPVPWRDKKRYLWILGLVVPATPLAGIGLFQATDQAIWFWLTPVVFFAVIPLIDLVAGYWLCIF